MLVRCTEFVYPNGISPLDFSEDLATASCIYVERTRKNFVLDITTVRWQTSLIRSELIAEMFRHGRRI